MPNESRKTWGGEPSFLTATLKGISQVLLIENAFTGFLILIAITVSSLSLGIIALISAVIGTFIGKIGGADENSINAGLFGYNSVLTGIALMLFLSGDFHWIIALFGAAFAALLTATMMHLMKNSGIPVLTFPFIIMTWLILLASYRLKAFPLSPDLVPQDLLHWQLDISGKVDWLEGTFNGIGQIFFLHNTASGILLFIAVFLAGWRFGLFAIIGNSAALLTSYFLGGEHSLIFMGLYGYNAILTMFAVSLVFKGKPSKLAILVAILVSCFTVPVTASITTSLTPFGLPTLTMPFVLTTWLLLAARKVFPRF